MNIKKKIAAASAWAVMAVFFCVSPKACAEEADWNTTLQQLKSLQTQAENFLQQSGADEGRTAQELAFAYLRGIRYNDGVWALLNRQSDSDFENYVQQNAPQLAELQTLQTLTVPTTGEEIDFGHMMASCSLASEGLSVAGSWGGDCMELAETTLGSSADLSSLMALQAQTFNIEDQSLSVFSAQDLRADMDAVNLSVLLEENENIAETLQSYYQTVDVGSRVQSFAQNQFGNCDLSQQNDFREQVYSVLLNDEGMQLLLALHDMWDNDHWQLQTQAELPLRAAAYLLADYIAETSPQKNIQAIPEDTASSQEERLQNTPTAQPTAMPETTSPIDQKQAQSILEVIVLAAILCGVVFIVMIVKIMRAGRR